MFLEVKITGTSQTVATLRKIMTDTPQELAIALYREAELTMTQCKREVPVDTGALRSSGFVREPEISAGSISVELGFGGAATSYAEKVHEDLNAHHVVGKAKYLEDPVRRRAKVLYTNLIARTERIIAKKKAVK